MFDFFRRGRQKKNPKEEPGVPTVEIAVRNRIADADLWILPDVEKNRHTTLWGKATLSRADVSEDLPISVRIPSEPGTYLIRLIDSRQMYYAVGGVGLREKQTIVIENGERPMTASVRVQDPAGEIVSAYELFVARL